MYKNESKKKFFLEYILLLYREMKLNRPVRLIFLPLNFLQFVMSSWNWSEFGHIESNLDKVKREIQAMEIQDAEGCLGDTDIAKLSSAYNLHSALLRQISLKWQSKSRLNWLLNGDLNTSFFHRVTQIKRRRNQINFLINGEGTHLTSPFDIHNEFSNFYIKLWTQDASFCLNDLVAIGLPVIPEEASSALTAAFSLSEIWDALCDMPKGKAPGPDGFHSEFYLRSWSIINRSLLNAFLEFQNSSVLPRHDISLFHS